MTDRLRFSPTGRPTLRAFAAALAILLMQPAGPAQAIPLARAPAMTTESALVKVQYAQPRPMRRRAPARHARRGNGNGNALAAAAIGAMVLGVTAAIASDRRRERRERRAYQYGYGYQPYQEAYVPAPVYRQPRHRSRPVYHSGRAYPGAPVVRHRAQRPPFAGPRHEGRRQVERRHWRHN